MIVKNQEELEGLRKIGKIVAEIRDTLKEKTVDGITTKELDKLAGELFEKHGAQSAPKSEYDFPGYTCISVNDEVAHGIPGNRVIKDGDLVNIDVSASLEGFYADTGISFVAGATGNKELEELCACAQRAFEKGFAKIKAGTKLNQIGKAVEREAADSGLAVIKNLTGHGVGRSLHEKPDHVLNYFEPWDRQLLKEGTVIAFEPFISQGDEEVEQLDDGWTYKTPNSHFVAQVEHTVVVTKDGAEILTK